MGVLDIIIPIGTAIVGIAGGIIGTYTYDRKNAESKVAKADIMVKKMIDDAQKRAETIKKETIIEAKEEVYRLKTENEREEKMRGVPVMLNDLIPIYCVETSQVFDLTTRKFSDKIINSADTDIQVLIASIDLIGLLISGNQLVITSKSNFQQ